MLSTSITAFYAGLLGIFYLYLSLLVMLGRREHQVSMGDGGERHFRQVIRGHGNFSEYVPLALVLLLVAEINHITPWLLHVSGATLLLSRLLHAYGLRHHPGVSWQRFWGALGTLAAIAALAVANLLVLY